MIIQKPIKKRRNTIFCKMIFNQEMRVRLLLIIAIGIGIWKLFLTDDDILPQKSGNFVGREYDMEKLLSKVNFESNSTETRIIGIVGFPGVGKSTLANKLGHRLIEQGVHVRFVDFNDFLDGNVELYLAEKILRENIFSSLEVQFSDSSLLDKIGLKANNLQGNFENPDFEKLLKWARGIFKQTVIIVDNCDVMFRVPGAKSNFTNAIKKLVEASKSTRVKIVTTSRENLMLSKYYYGHRIKELSLNASVLLLENKLQTQSDSEFVEISYKQKETIANLTGNVPLALDIVGALLTHEVPLSPETIINELESDPMTALEFQPELKMSASIALSFTHLDDHLKKVAAFLSFFPGSFTKNASIKISRQLRDEKIIITDSDLTTLVSLSLLEFKKSDHNRYQYHRLIQKFLEKKRPSEISLSEQFFLGNFSAYYLEDFHLHTLQFSQRHRDSLQFLDAERHNIYYILAAVSLESLQQIPESKEMLLIYANILYKVALAIDDVNYLTNRFTGLELLDLLNKSVAYLTGNYYQLDLQNNFSLSLSTKEYLNTIYLKLLITYSKLLAKTKDIEAVINFMEKHENMVNFWAQRTHHFESYCGTEINCKMSLKTSNIIHQFYRELNKHYVAVGQYSKVKCPNCSYYQIGLMYFDINPMESIRNHELSLKHENMSIEKKLDNLLGIFLAHLHLREMKGDWLPYQLPKEINDTVDRIFSEYQNEKNEVIFKNWDLITKGILFAIKFQKINLTFFLEEKLLQVMSDPNFQFQTKNALDIMESIKNMNNITKIVSWGSLFLTRFEDYNDNLGLSIEDTVNILHINFITSEARITFGYMSSVQEGKKHIAKGCEGMKNIFETIDLQNHTNKQLLHLEKIYNLAKDYLITVCIRV